MCTYEKALSIIRVCVDAMTDGRHVVLEDRTLERPYGWVFFYQTREYAKTGNILHAIAGSTTIIFNRFSWEYRFIETGLRPLEVCLKEYEATLPKSQLQATQARICDAE